MPILIVKKIINLVKKLFAAAGRYDCSFTLFSKGAGEDQD